MINMRIKKVRNASEHAMGRVGRILGRVVVADDGTATMEYLQTDRNLYGFHLHNAQAKDRWFSKVVVLSTAEGTYELVPATAEEIAAVHNEANWKRTLAVLQAKYGDSISYMAPEMISLLAKNI